MDLLRRYFDVVIDGGMPTVAVQFVQVLRGLA